MKKLRLLLPVLLALLAFSLPAKADSYTVNRNDLPETAQKFLKEYFPKAKIGMIKIDTHLLKSTDYDVKLVDGTKIEFNNNGEWTSVDCKTKEIPSGLMMKKIRDYVKKNFPDTYVVEIEKKVHEYQLELNDGVEVKFDRLGNFKSVKIND